MTRVTLTMRGNNHTVIYKDVAEVENYDGNLSIKYWNEERIVKDVYLRCDIFRYSIEEISEPIGENVASGEVDEC